MSNTCPVCGKGEGELFVAGYEDEHEVWGGRYVSHLACVMSQREESLLMKARYQECEYALAALKAQRCETCRLPTWYEHSLYGHCMRVSHIEPDFGCNLWAERGTK